MDCRNEGAKLVAFAEGNFVDRGNAVRVKGVWPVKKQRLEVAAGLLEMSKKRWQAEVHPLQSIPAGGS